MDDAEKFAGPIPQDPVIEYPVQFKTYSTRQCNVYAQTISLMLSRLRMKIFAYLSLIILGETGLI